MVIECYVGRSISRVLPERILEYLEKDKIQMVRNVRKYLVRCVTLYYKLRCVDVMLLTQVACILIGSVNVLNDIVVGVNTG